MSNAKDQAEGSLWSSLSIEEKQELIEIEKESQNIDNTTVAPKKSLDSYLGPADYRSVSTFTIFYSVYITFEIQGFDRNNLNLFALEFNFTFASQ